MKQRTVWVVRDVVSGQYTFFARKPVVRLGKGPCCRVRGCSACPTTRLLEYVGDPTPLGEPCAEKVDAFLPFLKRLPANTPVRVVIG